MWKKVQEEISELTVEIDSMNKEKMEKEFGDVFFSLINAARLYKINPDNALEHTNKKFIQRFTYLEEYAKQHEIALSDMPLAKMEEIWQVLIS